MKQIRLFFTIPFAVILFGACHNNNSHKEAKAMPATAVTDNAQRGDNFSCKIDGKTISGIVQYPGVIKPKHKMATVDFKTRDNKDTINLSFPNVVGTKVVDGSKFDESNEYYHLELALNGVPYMYQTFTVTVNAISDARATGTFSGVAKAFTSPKMIHITDGKFDIPLQGTIDD